LKKCEIAQMMSEFYQHKYGGIYIVNDDVATHTSTKEQLVIYTHVYPFERLVWATPASEWTAERFKKISFSEAESLMSGNREEFCIKINKAKAQAER